MQRKAKIKGTVLAVCLAFSAVIGIPLAANAEGETDWNGADIGSIYDAQLEMAGVDNMESALDADTLQYLEELGIDGADFDGLSNISLTAVVKLLVSFVRRGMGTPLKALGRLGAVLLVSAAGSALAAEENERLITAVSGGTAVVCLVQPLYESVKAALSCIGMAAKFEKLLIPVLAGILTASGNPAAALGFGSVTFAAAQCVEMMGASVILPLCGAALALGAAGAVNPTLKLGLAGEMITQITRKLFGFAAALFSSLLGLKEMMAKPADNLLNKGIRLAAGSFLPVVGGAVSEAYATVAGSFSLLASAVGGFGIAAVALICLPVITELVLWFLVLKAAETAAGMMNLPGQSALLKSFSSAVSLLNILVVYTVLIFIVSSGIALLFKA